MHQSLEKGMTQAKKIFRKQFYGLICKSVVICLFCVPICLSINAQSGRVKPSETPTPERPKVVLYPGDLPEFNPTKTSQTPPIKKDEDETIRVDSTLVPIPVSVTDSQGKAVTNLKLDDFDLQIDGKKEELSEVFLSTTPVRLAFLFDNSSSVMQAREFEKKAAIRFFRQVIRPDRDLASLYSVATLARLEQPLTKNVSQLVSAIENFPVPEGATSLLDGIIKAANYLKDFQGRRVIVVLSDGEDTLSDASLDDTVKAIQTANCQVYVVKTTDFENLKRSGVRIANSNVRALTAERRMQEIARQTGGAVYSPVDEDELERAFTRISAELSEQYILSYYPENAGERGQFREISLKIKNQPNYTIRSRMGYYVPKSVSR